MSIAETTTEPSAAGSDDELETDEELTRDDIFHVLQCRRRRLVLKYLHEYSGDEPADMSDIAEHIAALEHDTTVDALRSKQRQRVYIALYQSHLPKMDDAGVVNYNQDRGLVEPTPLASAFDRYLDQEPSLLSTPTDETPARAATESRDRDATTAESRDTDVSTRSLGAAGVVLATAGLGIGSLFLPALSGVGLAILASVLFLGIGLGHWLSTPSERHTADLVSSAVGRVK
ncbi:DUF7344 domain-containing protein [Haloarcula salina]|uniref:DUF7344 domain-containing protein n=1 Tax=Haloarcula salina TaxID=1429914 RepID=A0AA41G7S5_9EURY|nr:hypothetical protein [Haloarcula salina]MBV0901717.1 hypothetical protein [Haloarcula salina]